jgi:hypothetical protein
MPEFLGFVLTALDRAVYSVCMIASGSRAAAIAKQGSGKAVLRKRSPRKHRGEAMQKLISNELSMYRILPLAAAGAIAMAAATLSISTARADSPEEPTASPNRRTVVLPDESVSRVLVVCNWIPSYVHISNKNGVGQTYTFKDRETCKYAESAMALAGLSDDRGQKAEVVLELDLDKKQVLGVHLKD